VYVDKLQGDKARLEEQLAGKGAELASVSRENELLKEGAVDIAAKHKKERDQVSER
jgi:short-subunit dehydrogenase